MEVGELLTELFATSLVDELVVGVFAQAMRGRGGHGRGTANTERLFGKTRPEHRNALKGSAPMSALLNVCA